LSRKCAIIGAGASGLVAAIEAAKKGAQVTIFEKNLKCGRKLLATGNGRCNITNVDLDLGHFHGNNPKAIEQILRSFDTNSCVDYFRKIGLEIIEAENGKYFPMSGQARSVVELLVFTCKELGVSILLDSEVLQLKCEKEQFALQTDGQTHYFDRVLIASGSIASPGLGSSESGLEFARELGHNIYPTFASLVQLITKKDLKSISGVKLSCVVNVLIQGKKTNHFEGDVLFTNYGLSGLAILDASRSVGLALEAGDRASIALDLFPSFTKEALRGIFLRRMKQFPSMPILKWLEGVIHHKIAKFLISELGLSFEGNLDSKTLNKLVHTCKHLEFEVEETRGSKSAEVMAGGVALDEVNPKTMASNKINGLYFSGEVLDVDGDCGGYNLHFAWASGIKAGRAMAC
jgi:predicted Rossmann fold flavoprotein